MDTNIWPVCFLVLSLGCLLHCSAERKLPSAVVVGTVVCNTCFQQEFSKSSHLITGASVAVQCGDATTKSSFRKVAQTNWRGVFKVRLPTQVGKHIKTIQSCSVTLMKSSEPFCAVASSATSSNLRLKSSRNGVHVFSAGLFTFKPPKQPAMCYQKPKMFATSQKELAQQAVFLPAVPLLPPPNPLQPPLLPPNPLQPPPTVLPPNPLQPPPTVLPPNPLQPPPTVLPPNPLQPPPTVLPPNPLQPPPTVLPPNPFLPSPPPSVRPPLPPLPPFPFPTPYPLPPTFPLPPFPFRPPNPLYPGIPPRSPSKAKTP